MTVLADFARANARIARWLDKRVAPRNWLIDGNADFNRVYLPRFLTENLRVLDIGGGKIPCLTAVEKRKKRVHLTGLDIDASELEKAEPGAYDAALVADLTRFTSVSQYDLVVCRAVLEHVKDSRAAVRGLASALAPGGVALMFLPSAQALFAKINRILPEAFKRRVLFSIYPEMASVAGFPAYYDKATVRDYQRHCGEAGLEIVEVRRYFMSSYFHAFLPAWILWRIYLAIRYAMDRYAFCESFTIVVRRPADI